MDKVYELPLPPKRYQGSNISFHAETRRVQAPQIQCQAYNPQPLSPMRLVLRLKTLSALSKLFLPAQMDHRALQLKLREQQENLQLLTVGHRQLRPRLYSTRVAR